MAVTFTIHSINSSLKKTAFKQSFFTWRKGQDLNLRYLAAHLFSRQVHSTTLTHFRGWIQYTQFNGKFQLYNQQSLWRRH